MKTGRGLANFQKPCMLNLRGFAWALDFFSRMYSFDARFLELVIRKALYVGIQ